MNQVCCVCREIIASRREDVAALHALTAAGRDIGGPWGFGTRHIRGKAARKGGGGSRKRPPALAKAPSKRKPKREEIEVHGSYNLARPCM